MDAQVARLLIIIGCQRSGTTLTGQILGAPKDAVLLDEEDGFYSWFHAYSAGQSDAHERFSLVLSRASRKYEGFSGIISGRGGRFELAPHIRTVVLKAPNLTYCYRAIAGLDVPCSIIYPVRDVRSVVASMLRLQHIDFAGNQSRLIAEYPDLERHFKQAVGIMNNQSLPLHLRNAAIWKIKTGFYDIYLNQGISPVQFKYEDLVESPRSICELWFREAGIEFHPEMLSHQNRYQGLGPGKTDRSRAIDGASLTKWQTELSTDQAAEILELTQELMEKLNYAQPVENQRAD